ncbi:MAG: 3-dehydroquinate synthase [Candidatus Rokubacteria bacterium]|nr:3-dehydroquinate synthase [Candidatus Rokubacteria bacterium]
MRQITVHLGPRTYPVLVGAGLAAEAGRECARLGLGRRLVVVTQSGAASHARTVAESLRQAGFAPVLIEVPAGEAAKSLDEARALWDAFWGHGLDRGSAVVAVGGGAVGDLAGFAAATYMRGVACVQVPTTLLAQVDASIGGKVAINHPAAKNLIGTFHQPRLVLIDPGTLGSLPEREYRSGLAEVIKTGAALNAELFATLEASVPAVQRREPELLEAVITTCCAEKATIVEQDEREESGLRMVLNYGHTVGHALEALGGYQTWLHGEAVAAGIVVAARLSNRLKLTDARTAERQSALLTAVGLPTRFQTPGPREVWEALRRDKKAREGRVPFVLLKALGHAEVCFDVAPDVVQEVLREVHEGPMPRSGG